MKLRRLIWREILHRKLGFCLAVATVSIAVGCLVAVAALLAAHDHRSEELLAKMNDETALMETEFSAKMKAYEDSVRKTMKGLGVNVFIFPEGQELSEVYSEGFASKTMPEEYVGKLANSKIVTVNHLLPSLRLLRQPQVLDNVLGCLYRDEPAVIKSLPSRPTSDLMEVAG